MSRWAWFWICAILGLAAVIGGLLVPIHLRAVDASVLQEAGKRTPNLIRQALSLIGERKLGAAQLLLQAAQAQNLDNREELGRAAVTLAKQQPRLQFWGGPEPRLESLADPRRPDSDTEPFTEFLIRQQNRRRALDLLDRSKNPGVQELLRARALSRTMVFAPANSASGQALEAALGVTGLLLEEGHISSSLSNAVVKLAMEASRPNGNSHPLEQTLLDFLSLGQRFNYGQLVVFVSQIQDTDTLRQLSALVRKAEERLPILFSAVNLSGQPAAVARYLMTFSQTGLGDIAATLRFGQGGLRELLARGQRLHATGHHQELPRWQPFHLLPEFAYLAPRAALATKCLLYLLGGYLLAAAGHFLLLQRRVKRFRMYGQNPQPRGLSGRDRPVDLPPVRGFHVARELLFALGFLLVVLLLSEPFLAQESQKVDFPFKLRLPMVGSAVPAGATAVHSTFMNQLSLLTLLLFFVLQGLIYTACLFKLAEIRRQNVPPRMKLKLLENEDHLFDAGLYLGFVGTIISLILVSLGVIKPSLMAAYSSTSFGIIFVSVFKIFHLRPLRRRLLIEAEITPESAAPSARAFATQP